MLESLLCAFQIGDIGVDADGASLARAVLAHPDEAPVGEVHDERAPRLAVSTDSLPEEIIVAVCDPLDQTLAHHVPCDVVEMNARLGELAAVGVDLAKALVAQDQPVVGIVEREALADDAERVRESLAFEPETRLCLALANEEHDDPDGEDAEDREIHDQAVTKALDVTGLGADQLDRDAVGLIEESADALVGFPGADGHELEHHRGGGPVVPQPLCQPAFHVLQRGIEHRMGRRGAHEIVEVVSQTDLLQAPLCRVQLAQHGAIPCSFRIQPRGLHRAQQIRQVVHDVGDVLLLLEDLGRERFAQLGHASVHEQRDGQRGPDDRQHDEGFETRQTARPIAARPGAATSHSAGSLVAGSTPASR